MIETEASTLVITIEVAVMQMMITISTISSGRNGDRGDEVVVGLTVTLGGGDGC